MFPSCGTRQYKLKNTKKQYPFCVSCGESVTNIGDIYYYLEGARKGPGVRARVSTKATVCGKCASVVGVDNHHVYDLKIESIKEEAKKKEAIGKEISDALTFYRFAIELEPSLKDNQPLLLAIFARSSLSKFNNQLCHAIEGLKESVDGLELSAACDDQDEESSSDDED
jgi:hypothetical protein